MNELDSPNRFELLPIDQQNILVSWINENLKPRKTFNVAKTSYGMKDLFERSDNGFLIDNGTFKGGMLKAGFLVKDKGATNWVFNVSKKSPGKSLVYCICKILYHIFNWFIQLHSISPEAIDDIKPVLFQNNT